jgi:hypothetical protein
MTMYLKPMLTRPCWVGFKHFAGKDIYVYGKDEATTRLLLERAT